MYKDLLVLPDVARTRAVTGFCHVHSPGTVEDLTGKRIVFTKWSDREFRFGGHHFCILHEAEVLAEVIDEA
jgi:co-chaperonin GroES (HSP10)